MCADSYKICRFCHNHIRQNLNNKCPACRREYSDEALQEKPVSTEECVFRLCEIRWGGPLIVCIATLQPPPTCAAEEAARARAKGSRRARSPASGECTRRAAQRRVRRRHRPALCQGRGTFHEQIVSGIVTHAELYNSSSSPLYAQTTTLGSMGEFQRSCS